MAHTIVKKIITSHKSLYFPHAFDQRQGIKGRKCFPQLSFAAPPKPPIHASNHPWPLPPDLRAKELASPIRSWSSSSSASSSSPSRHSWSSVPTQADPPPTPPPLPLPSNSRATERAHPKIKFKKVSYFSTTKK